MIIAALIAGNLLACNLALRAADTNTPPSAPPAGTPPPGPRPSGMRGGPTLEQLTQQLSLTDEQKPKVKAILESRDKKMADVRDLAPEDRRPKMQSIREETTAQLKAVLTPEQFDKFQKMSPRGHRPGPPPGGGNPGGANAPAPPPNN